MNRELTFWQLVLATGIGTTLGVAVGGSILAAAAWRVLGW